MKTFFIMKAGKQTKRKEPSKPNKYNYGIIGIVLFALVLFLKVSTCDFLTNWDDDSYVVNNPAIQQLSWENIKTIFSSFYVSNYQPLSILSYALEFSIFKLKPAAYHITNLLFHLANIFLVFRLFKELKMSQVVCYTVAILFAIHPTRVESVAWISERKDLMYALFYLLSLIYYVKFRSEQQLKIYLLSLGFFLCSLLSKSMAITLPVILVLIDIFLDRKFDPRKLLDKIPFFALSIVFGLLALYSQSQQGEAMVIARDYGVFDRILLIFYGIGQYFSLVFAPFNLSAIQYYPIEPGDTMPVSAYVSVAAVIGLILLALKSKNYRFEIGFGLLFFFASIGIVLQFVPFGHAVIAERYTYLPYLGLFFIIGVYLDQLLKDPAKKSIVFAAAAIFLIYLATITYQRIPVWHNSITLFTDVVEKFPNSANAYWYRGNVYRDYKKLELAIKDYSKSIALAPAYDKAYFNRACALAALEKNEASLPDYDKTIELNAAYTPAYLNKANSLFALKRYDEALQLYQKAIAIDSSFQQAHLGMADVFIAKNEPAKAKPIYEQYLVQHPGDAKILNNLGVAQYNSGARAEACASWGKAADLGNGEARGFIGKFCE